MPDFTERQLNGLDPIVVYDPSHTKDEEGNIVDRQDASQPMLLVMVGCVKPENVAPNMVALPYDYSFDPHTHTPVIENKKTVLKEVEPPATPEEVLKELALRQEFDAKKRQDEEAQFTEFKRTKEGKDEVPKSIQANP